MNVFKYELKQYKKSIIVWSIAYALFTAVIMSATPLFIDETAGMRSMIAQFPDAFREALGVDADTFLSAVGFFSYTFLYLGLVAAIQAMSLGVGIISKENRMKTADFLMSKPKKRESVYLQKLLAAVTVLAITEAVFFISATLSMIYQSGGDFNVTAFVLISLTFTFIQLMFMAIGLFLAAVIDKIKSTINVTMGVCFGFFMVGMVSAIAGSDTLRYLSPLKYFDNNYIMTNGTYETGYAVLGAALTLVLIAASFIVYVKKDIKAVT